MKLDDGSIVDLKAIPDCDFAILPTIWPYTFWLDTECLERSKKKVCVSVLTCLRPGHPALPLAKIDRRMGDEAESINEWASNETSPQATVTSVIAWKLDKKAWIPYFCIPISQPEQRHVLSSRISFSLLDPTNMALTCQRFRWAKNLTFKNTGSF